MFYFHLSRYLLSHYTFFPRHVLLLLSLLNATSNGSQSQPSASAILPPVSGCYCAPIGREISRRSRSIARTLLFSFFVNPPDFDFFHRSTIFRQCSIMFEFDRAFEIEHVHKLLCKCLILANDTSFRSFSSSYLEEFFSRAKKRRPAVVRRIFLFRHRRI